MQNRKDYQAMWQQRELMWKATADRFRAGRSCEIGALISLHRRENDRSFAPYLTHGEFDRLSDLIASYIAYPGVLDDQEDRLRAMLDDGPGRAKEH